MNILFENLESLIDAPNGIQKALELVLQLAVQGKLTSEWRNSIYERHPELVSGSKTSVQLDDSSIYEPASELLKKIKKEKEKLIAEGKIKKQNELPPIKDSEKPFELPKGWEWVRLLETFDVRDGTHDTPKYVDNGFPLVTSKNIYSGRLDFTDIKFISEDDHRNISLRSKVDKEDILFAMIGSIGNPVIVDTKKEFSIKNVALFKYYSRNLSVPEYLLLFLSSIEKKMKSEASGAVQSFVSLAFLRNYLFPLPPFDEQKRIVEKVNSLMALLDELEEKRERRNQKRIKLNNASLEKLLTSKNDKEQKTNWKRIEENFSTLYSVPENVDKLKQGILQLAVQGKLVEQNPKDEPASELLKKIKKEKDKLIAEGKIRKQNELPPIKDEERPFELPKGWEWVRNGEILNELLGGFSYKSDSFIRSGENQVLRLGNIRPSRLRLFENPVFISDELASETEKFSLKENDILITMTGTKGKRDYCYTVRLQVNKFEGRSLFLNQRVGCFRYNQLLNISFVDIVLKNDLMLDLMYASSTGTANQANIGITILNEILIPLPPLNEQKRIVEKVNELMSLCNTLEEKLTKKEATAEKLVGAVVNAVANKTNKPKDDKADKKEMMTELIKDLIKQHPKALTKLS